VAAHRRRRGALRCPAKGHTLCARVRATSALAPFCGPQLRVFERHWLPAAYSQDGHGGRSESCEHSQRRGTYPSPVLSHPNAKWTTFPSWLKTVTRVNVECLSFSVSQCAGSLGLLRSKCGTKILRCSARFCVPDCAHSTARNETTAGSERPIKVAEKETVAPTRRRHTGRRAGVAAGERRKR
jgi:hypothetical protein